MRSFECFEIARALEKSVQTYLQESRFRDALEHLLL
jgi:hypothetical protein